MKKLLVLVLAVFIFYGCKQNQTSTTSSSSSDQDSILTKDVFVILSSSLYGLYAPYLDNLCNKNAISLEFNGNKYSKIEAQFSVVQSNLSGQDTRTQKIEENTDSIILTTSRTNKKFDYYSPLVFKLAINKTSKQISFDLPEGFTNSYNIKDITSLCEVYNSNYQTAKSIYNVVVSDKKGESFNINGQNIQTLYTKAEIKNKEDGVIKDKSGKVVAYADISKEVWTASNGELKGFGVQDKNTLGNNDSTTTTMRSYSFTKSN